MIAVIPDKFKGTLSSTEVAQAIAEELALGGISQACECIPMADGGQGMADALGCEIHPCGMFYVFNDIDGKKAVYVPSCGEGLPWQRRMNAPPFPLRSSGAVGEAVFEAVAMMPDSTIYVGIGGTLSADIGIGFLEALCYTFIYGPQGLERIECAPDHLREIYRTTIVGLADVQAPLIGPGLSALSFIPQKGGTRADIMAFEERAQEILRHLPETEGASPDRMLHAGAGGGLGFALETIMGCRCGSGAEYVLTRAMRGKDPSLIITGEGMIDGQTRGGKVVDAVYCYGAATSVPVVAFCGKQAPDAAYPNVFPCIGFNDPTPVSKADAIRELRTTVARAIPQIKTLLER